MKKEKVKKGAEMLGGKYSVEIDENGKRIYKWLDGVELKTSEWELGGFIDYCLYPIRDFAKSLIESEDEPPPEGTVLERLYDAAMWKIEQMIGELEKRTGTTKIIMTQFVDHDFLRQDIVDVTIKAN